MMEQYRLLFILLHHAFGPFGGSGIKGERLAVLAEVLAGVQPYRGGSGFVYANLFGGGFGQINDSAVNIGAAVIDAHHHAPFVALIDHQHDGAQRQGFMRRGIKRPRQKPFAGAVRWR